MFGDLETINMLDKDGEIQKLWGIIKIASERMEELDMELIRTRKQLLTLQLKYDELQEKLKPVQELV